MLPRKDHMAEVATLMGLFLRLSIFTPVSIQYSIILLLAASPTIFFRVDYLIIVISKMHHDANANAAKGSSL